MLDNPVLILCLLGLCWPGIVPLVLTYYVARNYDLKNPLHKRGKPLPPADI